MPSLFSAIHNPFRKHQPHESTMGHASASINGTVIAETDTWENVEGNVYVGLVCHS